MSLTENIGERIDCHTVWRIMTVKFVQRELELADGEGWILSQGFHNYVLKGL